MEISNKGLRYGTDYTKKPAKGASFPLSYSKFVKRARETSRVGSKRRFSPRPANDPIYGVVLWVFALYVMAHLVAGNSAFLGWGGITWVALWGHIIYGLVVAWVAESRRA